MFYIDWLLPCFWQPYISARRCMNRPSQSRLHPHAHRRRNCIVCWLCANFQSHLWSIDVARFSDLEMEKQKQFWQLDYFAIKFRFQQIRFVLKAKAAHQKSFKSAYLLQQRAILCKLILKNITFLILTKDATSKYDRVDFFVIGKLFLKT